jgi:hypothetical protein
MSEWPGYTPPSSGSSQNSGTHPLSTYTNAEAAIKAQYAADGADTSQEPPQYYGAWTVQKRNEPEAHATPGVPGTPVASLPGGAGNANVTWAASVPPPDLSYVVTASTGATKTVKPTATSVSFTGLTAGATTFTVKANNQFSSSAASAASNSVTVT